VADSMAVDKAAAMVAGTAAVVATVTAADRADTVVALVVVATGTVALVGYP